MSWRGLATLALSSPLRLASLRLPALVFPLGSNHQDLEDLLRSRHCGSTSASNPPQLARPARECGSPLLSFCLLSSLSFFSLSLSLALSLTLDSLTLSLSHIQIQACSIGMTISKAMLPKQTQLTLETYKKIKKVCTPYIYSLFVSGTVISYEINWLL